MHSVKLSVVYFLACLLVIFRRLCVSIIPVQHAGLIIISVISNDNNTTTVFKLPVFLVLFNRDIINTQQTKLKLGFFKLRTIWPIVVIIIIGSSSSNSSSSSRAMNNNTFVYFPVSLIHIM